MDELEELEARQPSRRTGGRVLMTAEDLPEVGLLMVLPLPREAVPAPLPWQSAEAIVTGAQHGLLAIQAPRWQGAHDR